MLWLGMILALTLAQLPQVWSEWGFRITVISSIAANLVVGILSGTRRRSAPRWWRALLGEVAMGLLWLAYEGGEKAAESALGKLSLSDSDASSEEKQVAAFWATFLLLHLGGPDNLTAYALEDNKMAKRKVLESIFRVAGAIYTIYHNTNPAGGRSWALLLAASVVMLVAGAVSYVEKAAALGKANLDSMQEDAASSSSSEEGGGDFGPLECKIRRAKRRGRLLCDGEALLLAQDLFPIWRHALVDSSVDPASSSPRQKASEMILSPTPPDEWGREWDWDWESLCSVAEMELSLIYELLYTKAILARTCYYYLVRLLSPLFTAAAAFLFRSWHQQQQRQQVVRGSFVRITYALLAITFLMDVAWLLRALGSTWAYAYFQAGAGGRRRRWWCRIHRVAVWLDPLQLLCIDPVSHRRWSGTIGRYNLLHECTATPSRINYPEWCPVSAPGDDKPKELRYLCKLPPCVKKVVFERVKKILQEAIKTEETQFGEEEDKEYTRVDIRTRWGDKAFRCEPEDFQNKFKNAKVNPFGQEFEEDILLWHIATCMLLLLTDDIRDARKGTTRRRILACAIEVMSEYMMFLVSVRRKMLPGLVLHSQLEATRKALDDAWERHKPPSPGYGKSNKEELAKILRFARPVVPNDQLTESEQFPGTEGTELVVHAVNIYFHLTDDERPRSGESIAAPRSRRPRVTDERLEFIFNVWVDKLVYAAVRCSRDAHAEQLSKGGDLTTVLWMLIQHAGPFYIQNADNITYAAPPHEVEVAAPPPPEELPKEKPKKEEPAPPPPKKAPEKEEPAPPSPPRRPPMAPWPMPMFPTSPGPSPRPPPCPMSPPYYYPSWPPVCPPPYYNPSCPPVCPWHPQCTPQHERPGEEPEEDKEDEHGDSSSDEDSESEE